MLDPGGKGPNIVYDDSGKAAFSVEDVKNPLGYMSGAMLGLSKLLEAEGVISRKKRDIDNLLGISSDILNSSFNSIVSDGKDQLEKTLYGIKRKVKYTKEDFLVPRLARKIDDQKIIQEKGVKMPFLEEKIVDNPDYEDIFARKIDIVTKEIKLYTKQFDVELPPEKVQLRINLDDDLEKELFNMEYKDDYLNHIILFLRLAVICQDILNEEFDIKVVLATQDKIKKTKELFDSIGPGPKLDYEVWNVGDDRFKNLILTFKANDSKINNFDYFSQKKNTRPTVLKQNSSAYLNRKVDLKDNLTKSKAMILEYFFAILKQYYEF